jgi:hypothetical protein
MNSLQPTVLRTLPQARLRPHDGFRSNDYFAPGHEKCTGGAGPQSSFLIRDHELHLRGTAESGRALREVIKEVVGIHLLLSPLLFACDILRSFLPRVSLAKSTSAHSQF